MRSVTDAGADLALLALQQAADVGVMLEENQRGHDQDERQPGPAGDEVIEDDRPRRPHSAASEE